MKAWIVREKDEFSAAVVFAETRGQAKYLARLTDACEDVPYTRIEAIRIPSVDKYYKEGMTWLDWRDQKDRLIMVKECGFTCDHDSFYAGLEDCHECQSREYCDMYQCRFGEDKEDIDGEDSVADREHRAGTGSRPC